MSTSPRIVSLIASATEIAAALGGGDWLVGRSHECDYPPDIVARLPVCSAPRIDIHASSLEIDRQVKQRLTDAIAIYEVKADVIERLQPTVILTQTQCDVCAVSLKDVQDAACERISSRPQIVPLGAMGLSDVWDDIRRVAAALDIIDRGERVVSGAIERLERLRERTAPLPCPTVACLEWLEPLMAAGNWVPELVEIAGGRNQFGAAGRHSPWMTWDDLVASDPDVIVVMPCGFDIPRTLQEMSVVTAQPAWPRLRAVREGRVFVTDGNQYFNRPGPRLVESAEILAEVLHGLDYGHAGRGWKRME
ncbi:MAG: cobalamin-binding protein [Planctomycetaceae bacterium]|nr:cobalamin-binding protein [Planctomycetaceae bacterium]